MITQCIDSFLSLSNNIHYISSSLSSFLPVSPKALYDIDALEEERITEWHSGASPSSFSFPDVSEEVRGRAEKRGEREREEKREADARVWGESVRGESEERARARGEVRRESEGREERETDLRGLHGECGAR